jgi:hypothetical protein
VTLFGIGWQFWLSGAAGLAVAVAAGLWWRGRRPRDPEEIERRRREHLSRVGRIVEGEILEITEAPAAPPAPRNSAKRATNGSRLAGETGSNGARSLVLYTYSISGVTYEAGQDITGFEQRACLKRVIAGQPASVKYDPSNPGNSMLIADDWSGID